MKRTCRESGQPFTITPADLEFYSKISPKIGDRVFEVPPPTLCPEERLR